MDSKKNMLTFGCKYCLLDTKKSEKLYEIAMSSVKTMLKEMQEYMRENSSFRAFGEQFLQTLDKDTLDGIL